MQKRGLNKLNLRFVAGSKRGIKKFSHLRFPHAIRKRAMSAIITTVILVALSMVAVLIVWGVIGNIIENSSSDIESRADLINLNMKIVSVKQDSGNLFVLVKRSVGSGSFSGLSFIIEYNDSSSEIISKELEVGELQTVGSSLDISGNLGDVEKVSVASFFNDSGKVKIGRVLDVREVSFGLQSAPGSLNEGLVLDLDFNDGSLVDKSGFGNDGIAGSINLIRNGGAEKGLEGWYENINSTVVNYSDSHSGEGGFYAVGLGKIDRDNNFLSSELIPIDVNDNYTLSGWFKSNGIFQSNVYFGFAPYDENKEFIPIESVYYINSSVHTTLYEDISSSDKIIKINDCTGWVGSVNNLIAFNVDDSGSFSDLPNKNLSKAGIIRVENVGGYCEVEFSTSVNINAPAGTKIREHGYGGTFQYAAANNQYVPYVWTKYEGSVSGEALYHNGSQNIWRPGTKYARILVIMNYRKDENYSMFADDFNLTSSNGQRTGPLFVNEGKYGGAREFDGVDDSFDIVISDSINITDNMTISFWTKFDGVPSGPQTMFSVWTEPTNGYYIQRGSNGGLYFISKVGYLPGEALSKKTIDSEEWHSIAFTIDNGAGNYYFDGEIADAASSMNLLINSSILTIGGHPKSAVHPNGIYFFNGSMDEIKMYNRVLSISEVQELYSQGYGV